MGETELVQACLKLLRWKGHYAQRVHCGTAKRTINGRDYHIHLCDRGTPDILSCINVNGEGRFLAIEVKTSERAKKAWHRSVNKSKELKTLLKSDMTAVSQYEQMNLIEQAGGFTALVSSLKELEHVIKVVLETKKP